MNGEAGGRITYLIANCNRSAWLPDCLASLLAQTSAAWLALIVDDASTDDSLAVVAAVPDPRIRLLRNERNLGYIASLERLLEEAATDIVAVLDPDDALAPEATETLLRTYAAQPDAAFVYSRFASYDERLAGCRAVHGGAIPPRGTALCDGPVGAIRSFRRSAYRRTAGLDPGMLYAEDRDLVYKLEEVTSPIFLDAVLYRYRELPDSQSRDPEKRAVGVRNTRRARRAALRRRNVRGVRRVLWEAWVWGDFVASSDRWSRPVRRLAAGVAAGSLRLLRAFSPAAADGSR